MVSARTHTRFVLCTNMFCISNVFKDHAMEYQTEEDPFGALKRDELL